MTRFLFPWGRWPCCALVVLGLALGGLWTYGREPLTRWADDRRESLYWQAVHEEAKEQGLAIDRRRTLELARLAAKQEICRELIADRISLAEAVERADGLPSPPPGFRDNLKIAEQGTTHRERLSRHLIDYACSSVIEPAAQAALRQRLTEELESSLAH